MCTKYQESNLKTVPWAQKLDFCQKKKPQRIRKEKLSTLTQKMINFSKNKVWHF